MLKLMFGEKRKYERGQELPHPFANREALKGKVLPGGNVSQYPRPLLDHLRVFEDQVGNVEDGPEPIAAPP